MAQAGRVAGNASHRCARRRELRESMAHATPALLFLAKARCSRAAPVYHMAGKRAEKEAAAKVVRRLGGGAGVTRDWNWQEAWQSGGIDGRMSNDLAPHNANRD